MWPRRLFRTRVASRILALFFVGAIVPVVVLQILSFRAVSNLLERQTEERLVQLADASVQIILERLASSTSWVTSAGGLLVSGDGTTGTVDRLAHSISGLAITASGNVLATAGSVRPLPALQPEETARLSSGQPLLKHGSALGTQLHLVIPQTPEGGELLWALLHADSIWASAMVLGAGPNVAEICVLDSRLRPFACKTGPDSDLPQRLQAANPAGVEGLTRFERDGEEYLAAWKRVYLRSAYGVPEWVVAVAESESSVHAPVASFAYNLPLALAVGVGMVLLLANFLVTRTMGPLEKLTEGTQRIARHDLTAQVDVESDDEFGELASSFNTMARRLRLQFDQIEAAHAIDRAVIEDNDAWEAMMALSEGLGRLSPGVRSVVVFVETTLEQTAGLYPSGLREAGVDGTPNRREVSPEELRALQEAVGGDGHALLGGGEAPGPLRASGIGDAGRGVLLVEMSAQGSLVGFVAMDFPADAAPGDDETRRARRLIGQAGVALNEHRLRGELVEFSDETLRALANAIDAKSRWTTGHSERVTALGTAIGGELGLAPQDLDTLHRGGLLHDVGKIGVSTAILDHPGKLDEVQRRAVEAHTVIGHRILEPIRVFRPMLPIVLHHHERWDGRGYPHGLQGDDIPYLARILSVADVFDALASPRPYRGPLAMDVVLEHIRSESGGAFDPRMVDAFDAVLAHGWVHEIPEDELFSHDV